MIWLEIFAQPSYLVVFCLFPPPFTQMLLPLGYAWPGSPDDCVQVKPLGV